MKKTSAKKPASPKKPPAKKAPTKKPSAAKPSATKPKPRKAQGQGELAQLVDRLADIVDQLGRIAQQLTEAGGQQPREQQDPALQTFAKSVAEVTAVELQEGEAPDLTDVREAGKHG